MDTDYDPAHCGACGTACAANQACVKGLCTDTHLTFSGVRQNLPVSSLTGWTQCRSDLYDDHSTSLSSIQSACTGANLMLACRPVGSTTLTLAAYAPRADVLTDSGSSNTPHNANGVGWYYNSYWCWGFAPEGDSIIRNACDVSSTDGTNRMCWHTGSGNIATGYRCGNTFLNGVNTWERLIFQAE